MAEDIAANIRRIRERIAQAAARAGRVPDDIKLMAVTKTVSPERAREAINAGIDLFGENYVQEAKGKIAALGKNVKWHMIGHLQTNKAKYVVRLFDCVQSVDRIELARELDKRARLAGCKLNVLIEVNVSGEQSKSGVGAADAPLLAKNVASLENISVCGLMTMPPYFENPEEARPYFRALRELAAQIDRAGIPGVSMKELSMGMTDDFEVAIEEGATIVRVGRAIFGDRR
ncbi:MAG TPA: YggS family pyridoxal phosphate-dependent enzyme [Smithellaceae bacterium]|nr:YggS family pyridoxal phosphate-dependent enzyme [Smithellaceae bacterium]HRS88829.1 YggS family pyridoxal phosphate-dependent enzyme [Smithellaceae bacterium]HRV25735.1 YggS family pyridoxal phosphate-dependent enzyme [Smithellaceae bacterium]